ncbi:MAG: hypothetical protein OXG88_10570 [Gammaproteobacteria bacterium]|nr:hypothetical protein [Gammaproteobacteria bacterium]
MILVLFVGSLSPSMFAQLDHSVESFIEENDTTYLYKTEYIPESDYLVGSYIEALDMTNLPLTVLLNDEYADWYQTRLAQLKSKLADSSLNPEQQKRVAQSMVDFEAVIPLCSYQVSIGDSRFDRTNIFRVFPSQIIDGNLLKTNATQQREGDYDPFTVVNKTWYEESWTILTREESYHPYWIELTKYWDPTSIRVKVKNGSLTTFTFDADPDDVFSITDTEPTLFSVFALNPKQSRMKFELSLNDVKHFPVGLQVQIYEARKLHFGNRRKLEFKFEFHYDDDYKTYLLTERRITSWIWKSPWNRRQNTKTVHFSNYSCIEPLQRGMPNQLVFFPQRFGNGAPTIVEGLFGD